RLALLHGKMKSEEKESVMKKFSQAGNKSDKIDILIATTIIEVGIDVANATVMVIEHAEHFGLSQLHQLRGRIGRSVHSSYCILLGSPETESARRRFSAFSQTQDGFKIAEEDLEIRGPGEFFGTRQHGLPEIRFGNIIKDLDIMEDAKKEADELIKKDPTLVEKKVKERFKI
ncbi:MAG: helicase-related protein, partial [Candidatus Omnitrophota bacterium]